MQNFKFVNEVSYQEGPFLSSTFHNRSQYPPSYKQSKADYND
jgi:hypothetical protein